MAVCLCPRDGFGLSAYPLNQQQGRERWCCVQEASPQTGSPTWLSLAGGTVFTPPCTQSCPRLRLFFPGSETEYEGEKKRHHLLELLLLPSQ